MRRLVGLLQAAAVTAGSGPGIRCDIVLPPPVGGSCWPAMSVAVPTIGGAIFLAGVAGL